VGQLGKLRPIVNRPERRRLATAAQDANLPKALVCRALYQSRYDEGSSPARMKMGRLSWVAPTNPLPLVAAQ
jgi:hypothetical protein